MCKAKTDGGDRCLGHLKGDRERLLATQRKRAAEGKQPTAKQVQRLQRLEARIEQAEAEHAAEQEKKAAEAAAKAEREAEEAAARQQASAEVATFSEMVKVALSEEDAEALRAAVRRADMTLSNFFRIMLDGKVVSNAPLTEVQGSHHLTAHHEGKPEGRLPSKSGQTRSVVLSVRVTKEQKRFLEQLTAANLLDTSVSSLCRALALGEDARRTYGDRSLSSRELRGLPRRTERLHKNEQRMRAEGESINEAWTRTLQEVRNAA